MSEERPAQTPATKARLPFDPAPFGGAVRSGALVLYSLLTIGLAVFALYMGVVGGHSFAGGYVAAPAIGAMWFALRVFMILGSRK